MLHPRRVQQYAHALHQRREGEGQRKRRRAWSDDDILRSHINKISAPPVGLRPALITLVENISLHQWRAANEQLSLSAAAHRGADRRQIFFARSPKQPT